MILLASIVLTDDRVLTPKQRSELAVLLKSGKMLWQREEHRGR